MRALLLALSLCAAALPAAVDAQITVAGGVRDYDAEEEESAAMVAVRTEFPIGAAALVEFASSVSNVSDPGRSSVRSVFEAQLQLPIRLGEVLTPYFGAGAGLGNTNRVSTSDDSGWHAVLSASVGMRAAITRQFGVVLDARARGIGTSFSRSHLDMTAGLRFRL